MEASWDGDSDGWYVRVSAITEQPSAQHPRYTEHCLYAVRGLDRQVERAVEFGTDLAEASGAEFYLTEAQPGDRRWWDDPAPWPAWKASRTRATTALASLEMTANPPVTSSKSVRPRANM